MIVAAGEDVLIDLATRSGPVAALLLIILWGGFKKEPWWVFGWVYRDLLERYNRRGDALDKLRETSIKATVTAELLAANKAPATEKDIGER